MYCSKYRVYTVRALDTSLEVLRGANLVLPTKRCTCNPSLPPLESGLQY